MKLELFFLAIKHIGRLRLRSWLTILGIIISITAVVALFSISDGIRYTIQSEFEAIGSNRAIITPKTAAGGLLGAQMSPAKLTDKDLEAMLNVNSVETAVPMFGDMAEIEFKREKKNLSVTAVPTDEESEQIIKDSQFLEFEKGDYFSINDRKKVIIGNGVANDVFKKTINYRDSIIINNQSFEVKGILEKRDSPLQDRTILIPIDDAKDVFKTEDYSSIIVTFKEGYDVSEQVAKIETELRNVRNVKKGNDDFEIETSEQIIEEFNNILNVVQVVFLGIVSISLIIGGIGIANTMLTSVMERTKEIGTLKAIGAKNSDVLMMFLFESGILGAVGGVIGVICGILLGTMFENIAVLLGYETVSIMVSAGLIFGALAFSFGVGVLFGIAPAYKASTLKPVDALRQE